MKILIPDKTSKADIKRIRNISNEIEISTLKIIVNENIIRKLLRNVICRLFPYSFYMELHNFLSPKKRYRFKIDDKASNADLNDIQILLANGQMKKEIMRNLLPCLPNLKWIHSTKTGVEHLCEEEILKRNIILTNSNDVHSKRIAEFVLACILEVTKRISSHIELMRKKKWKEISSAELEGKTIGIIGAGNIGTEVAKKAKAFGMKAIGLNRTVKNNPCFEKIIGPSQLPDILKVSDFLVICLPLNKETIGLIGKKEFSLMKQNAYIINVGRSEIIEEAALIESLKKKTIAGAILDVFHTEMQFPNHPYHRQNNVILTHYSAHSSSNSSEEVFRLFLINMKNFVNNEILINIVNLKGPN